MGNGIIRKETMYYSEKNGLIKTKKTKDEIIKVFYEVDFTLFDGSIFIHHSFLILKIILRTLPHFVKNKNIVNIFVLSRGCKKKYKL